MPRVRSRYSRSHPPHIPSARLLALDRSASGLWSCPSSPLYWNTIGPFGGWIAAVLLKGVLDEPEERGEPLTLPAQVIGRCGRRLSWCAPPAFARTAPPYAGQAKSCKPARQAARRPSARTPRSPWARGGRSSQPRAPSGCRAQRAVNLEATFGNISLPSQHAVVAAARLFTSTPITLLHGIPAFDGPMPFTPELAEAVRVAKISLRKEAVARLGHALPAGQPGRLDSAEQRAVDGSAARALLQELEGGRFDRRHSAGM